uniref:NADH dehydrogenase subunit 4L n=1 Tax=Rectidens sumatrensis TaxID=1903498 RepID=A0A8A3WKC0_9BIVA|nr:NADH dehydrogenase subunit 4L [Rectidens sumatrensis]
MSSSFSGLEVWMFWVVLVICCVVYQRHSMLCVLLSLEAFSLVLFYCCVIVLSEMQSCVGLGLMFLCLEVSVMSVCLSLLVKLVKLAGCDYVGVTSFS